MSRDQPCSTALAAYQRRSAAVSSLLSKIVWWPQGNCATVCCTIDETGASGASGTCTITVLGLGVCAPGGCTITFPEPANCAAGCCTITVFGQASAKARMYLRLRG